MVASGAYLVAHTVWQFFANCNHHDHNVMKVHFFGFNICFKSVRCAQQMRGSSNNWKPHQRYAWAISANIHIAKHSYSASTKVVFMLVFTSCDSTCETILIWNETKEPSELATMSRVHHRFWFFSEGMCVYEKRFYSVHWIAHLKYVVDTLCRFFSHSLNKTFFSFLIQYNFMSANSLKHMAKFGIMLFRCASIFLCPSWVPFLFVQELFIFTMFFRCDHAH